MSYTNMQEQVRINKPIWIRVNTAIESFAIGRTLLYQLIADGVIKSAYVKQKGKLRGKRLIEYDSLASYIESQVVTNE